MVALRSQGNWRWEGPLGTPLGLVHWKVVEMFLEVAIWELLELSLLILLEVLIWELLEVQN